MDFYNILFNIKELEKKDGFVTIEGRPVFIGGPGSGGGSSGGGGGALTLDNSEAVSQAVSNARAISRSMGADKFQRLNRHTLSQQAGDIGFSKEDALKLGDILEKDQREHRSISSRINYNLAHGKRTDQADRDRLIEIEKMWGF